MLGAPATPDQTEYLRFGASYSLIIHCNSSKWLPQGCSNSRRLLRSAPRELEYGFTSPDFGEYTERWSTEAEGDILVVVVPGCQKDVATVVKFANLFDLPFLAINRGHGTPSALGTIKHGVLVKMFNLDAIGIAADGKSATMGGGVYVDQALAKLAESNKRLVPVVASAWLVLVLEEVLEGREYCRLGAADGLKLTALVPRYMGYAGLISDNIIEMNVVTADGSEVKVSQSSNSDLYWGMRGAGHNYGIVTQFKHKIFDYPKGQDTYYVTYFFTGSQLEVFFAQLNRLLDNGNLPKDVNTYTLYLLNPFINPKPVILFQLYYFGTAADALPYLQPFLDLKPIIISNATTAYKNLAQETGTGIDGPICAPGMAKAIFPVGLKQFNIDANRQIYQLFSDMVIQTPALNGTIVQFEGYALQGMKAIDPASSAYAHREDNILVSFTTSYSPSPANHDAAVRYGRQARQIWVDGQKPRALNAYTNYAYGDETLQQVYGYEPWRLQRLRALKKKWDPKGKFNFYNPIV
ncbi:MAG: hypothetical protein Q9178_007258 [Gyalolechia marmorata]